MWEQVKGLFWFACLTMFLIALYKMGALDAFFADVPSVTVQ